MNKATLLTYCAEKEKVESIKKKSLKEQVPIEFHKYLLVFSEQEASWMPEHTSYDHKIDLKEDFEPKRSKIYRIDPVNKETLNKFIDENLQKDYIWKSLKDALQASGFFFVPKKDERMCPCQDYCYLNDYTIKNLYPLPRIDELIDSLSGMKLFIKMHICWGYNNVRIREGDKWKAAFICKRVIFEPTVTYILWTHEFSCNFSMNDGHNLYNTYCTGMAQDLYGWSSHCQQGQ